MNLNTLSLPTEARPTNPSYEYTATCEIAPQKGHLAPNTVKQQI